MKSTIDRFVSRPWHVRLRMWLCGRKGHVWAEYQENSAKRRCARCGRVEWLFGAPFPRIGQPAYHWEEMIP